MLISAYGLNPFFIQKDKIKSASLSMLSPFKRYQLVAFGLTVIDGLYEIVIHWDCVVDSFVYLCSFFQNVMHNVWHGCERI